MRLLAHSARPKTGIEPQSYADHVRAVESHACELALRIGQFWNGDRLLLQDVVRYAARWHDFGKLDEKNQEVLAGTTGEALPVPHEYAGVRYLRERNHGEAATLVYSHHRGLPGLLAEFVDEPLFENSSSEKARKRAEQQFDAYIDAYQQIFCGAEETVKREGSWRASARNWSGLVWRLALSCLIDADHSDTARHYGNEMHLLPADTRWAERRAALDRYVTSLQAATQGNPNRNALRQKIYVTCRDYRAEYTMYACDSGVGTGKTTAIMAHLLRVAEERKLRHVFIVLPYTNIINQSVGVYRRALVMDGEVPELIVAAHHHQVDFGAVELRQLATAWDCPITVTTAVQFFETMAACYPAKLRKLSELAGSAVFIDEAHAAIPARLWPQTWLWLEELVRDWGCHFVFGSGSLVRFWEHPDFASPTTTLPDLLPNELRQEVQMGEQTRVTYRKISDPVNIEELTALVLAQPGPRLVIVNTIRTAAEIANCMRGAGHDVLHLSTALAPRHRDCIVRYVRRRLRREGDRNWALVATSCVEAGVDLDFGSAFREMASASSMVQVGGRVNRHGTQSKNSIVWMFWFDDARTTQNPAMRVPAKVLADLFATGAVERLDAAALCTEALERELNEDPGGDLQAIEKAENKRDFPEVSRLYRVIDDETVLVLVEPVRAKFESGAELGRVDILQGSVRIRKAALSKFSVRPIERSDDLYAWTLAYDKKFLGYMDGVLQSDAAIAGEFLNA